MNNTIKSLLSALLIVGILSAIGCSKSSELGLSLVEQEQTDILANDTMALRLSTVLANKSNTYKRIQVVVGAYTDPIFGETAAAAYLNFRLTRTNATFTNCVLDSLVLSLAYEKYGHYGSIYNSSPSVQTWDILQLSDPILEQDYLSDATFSTGSVLKSGFTFTPHYKDSVYVGVDSVRTLPHLRIRLDDAAGLALGQEFLFPTTANVYNSNVDFKNWFKGLKIMPSSSATNSALIRFRFKHYQTKLIVYYTDTTGGNSVPKTFNFLTDEDAESVSSFEHNYTGTSVLDTTTTDTIVYLQGLDGVHTKIGFPNIESLGDIIVNKAELVVMVQDTGTAEYPEPIQLIAKIKDASGKLVLIDDIVTSLVRTKSYLLFGGVLEKDKNAPIKKYLYRFHLAEYMQAMVEGKASENAIYLTTASALDAKRIKLVKHNAAFAKAKLYLTYTKLK